MSAHKIQKPGNHSKERIQHSEHGEGFEIKDNRFVLLLQTDISRLLFYPEDIRKLMSAACKLLLIAGEKYCLVATNLLYKIVLLCSLYLL
jgi:hypothetical protein